MNGVISALLFFSALSLSPPGGNDNAQPALFGRPFCPYTVQFPSAPAQSETPSSDGSKIAAAELLAGGVRLSAFCAAMAPGTAPRPPLSDPDRKARVAGLVNALGISNYAVNDSEGMTPDCSEVDGVLDAKGTAYRIVSKLCFRADSTFIAEAVFGAATDEKVARAFVASLRLPDMPGRTP